MYDGVARAGAPEGTSRVSTLPASAKRTHFFAKGIERLKPLPGRNPAARD